MYMCIYLSMYLSIYMCMYIHAYICTQHTHMYESYAHI